MRAGHQSKEENTRIHNIVTQGTVAFWSVLVDDLLEEGQMHDWRHHYKVSPLCFKMAERFKNLDNILHDWAKDKYKSCPGIQQVPEA